MIQVISIDSRLLSASTGNGKAKRIERLHELAGDSCLDVEGELHLIPPHEFFIDGYGEEEIYKMRM